MSRRRAIVWLFAKSCLAAGLLALVLSQMRADPGDLPGRQNLWAVFRQAHWLWAAAAVLGFFLSMFISSLRWRLLLAVQSIHVSVVEIVRLACLAESFDVVIPGAFGGDLAKAYCLARQTPHKAAALVSVVADRVIGFSVTILIAASTLVILWLMGSPGLADHHLPLAAASIAVVVSGLVCAVVVLKSRRLQERLRFQRLAERFESLRWLPVAVAAADRYLRPGRFMLHAAGVTVASQVVFIGSIAMLARGLGLPIPWFGFLLCVPIIKVLSAFPLTPGSIGVVEELFVLYFAAWCGATAAVSLALTFRAATILLGLPGVLLILFGRARGMRPAGRDEPPAWQLATPATPTEVRP